MKDNTNNRDWVNAERPTQVRSIKPTRRSVSGFFMFRGKKSIPYESALERDFLILLSHNRLVNDIIPQPIQIKYTSNSGISYPYTPDYLVYFQAEPNTPLEKLTPPMLVEIKYRDELREKWHDLKPKFKTALGYAREQGWNFKIFDDTRIRTQRWTNIMFLQRYKRMSFPAQESQEILQTLKGMGQTTFDYLLNRHFFTKQQKAEGISHIWHLVYSHQIECDLTEPLNNSTVLWVGDYDK